VGWAEVARQVERMGWDGVVRWVDGLAMATAMAMAMAKATVLVSRAPQ